MIILGVESSAVSAGAAVVRDGKLIAECYLNTGLTHSETLLPLVDECLKNAGITLKETDVLAVAAGPGSFTGIRIGVSAVKGLCFADNKPVFPISTLEALATGAGIEGYIICPVMDARCQQVYTALFACENGEITRLTEDAPLKLEELAELLLSFEKKVLLVGDGSDLAYRFLSQKGIKITVFPEIFKYQHASCVAFSAYKRYNKGEKPISADGLMPKYLRLSQAERERQKKGEDKS